MPELPQPGETTRAVLDEAGDAWLMVFAILALALTLAQVRHAVLLTILFSPATAFGCGLLADFSDLLFGFWGTAGLILLPVFALLAKLLMRIAPAAGKWLATQFLLFGAVYPCLAGLDADRQPLYLNLFAFGLLAFIAWLLVKRLSGEAIPEQPPVVPHPAA